MMPIQNGQDQRFHPAPAGEHIVRVGRQETIDDRCHFELS
jgi:hypothetical protein